MCYLLCSNVFGAKYVYIFKRQMFYSKIAYKELKRKIERSIMLLLLLVGFIR